MEEGGCGLMICSCGRELCFFCGATFDWQKEHECPEAASVAEQQIDHDSQGHTSASRADSRIPRDTPMQQEEYDAAFVEVTNLLQSMRHIGHGIQLDITRLFPSGVPRGLSVFATPFGHDVGVRVNLEGATVHDFFVHCAQALLVEHPEDHSTRRILALTLILRRIDWFVLDVLENVDAWDSRRRDEEYAAAFSDLGQIVETTELNDEEGIELFSAFFQAAQEEAIVEAE
ncbi:hypothetical protein B0A48_02115 [Cryoendolithus antarcticus]|uniref:Uncharacterized protein n=1 Tax=Cryoendolithus antarcticus TaxID=1507870 RepID=A0A1V8TN65_9PEZI|nr:hypothetical protein B0A48_02115 [Cryoendolithus antarcticus]